MPTATPPHTEPDHHVAQLRNRRVSQNPLDIVLRDYVEARRRAVDAPTQVTTVNAVVDPITSARLRWPPACARWVDTGD